MNAKLWACVIAGVLVAHLSVLFILHHFRSAALPPPRTVVPNFTGTTTTFTNDRGEKVKVLHEFTVKTELASPEMLEKLPAPPQSDAPDGPSKIAAPDAPR